MLTAFFVCAIAMRQNTLKVLDMKPDQTSAEMRVGICWAASSSDIRYNPIDREIGEWDMKWTIEIFPTRYINEYWYLGNRTAVHHSIIIAFCMGFTTSYVVHGVLLRSVGCTNQFQRHYHRTGQKAEREGQELFI